MNVRQRPRTGATRRGTRDASPSDPLSYGITGWSASSGLGSATPGGIAGSAASGVSVVVAFVLNSLPGSNQNLASRRISANTGWHLRAASTSVLFTCGNGVALAASPSRTLVAGDVGKIHVVAGSHNLSAVFQYFDRVQVGASTAQAGYTPETTYTCVGSGSVQATNPASSFAILGVAGRDSPLSLADYQAICDATKLAGRLSLGAIPMDHLWRCPVGGAMPSTISDEVGADNLGFLSGSAANLAITGYARTWGF